MGINDGLDRFRDFALNQDSVWAFFLILCGASALAVAVLVVVGLVLARIFSSL